MHNYIILISRIVLQNYLTKQKQKYSFDEKLRYRIEKYLSVCKEKKKQVNY